MKTKIVITLIISTVLLSSFLLTNQTNAVISPPPSQDQYIQDPPFATRYWIKRLSTALPTGENIIFRVQYISDGALPGTITIYKNGIANLILKDDGTAPDLVSGDKIFAVYMKENITQMISRIETLEAALATKQQFLDFTGHNGQFIQYSSIVKFNKPSFNAFTETELSIYLINAIDCSTTDLVKEKSLFITDLSIVEDQQRTYNVATGVGNASGA
ncbi:MAG: hypothetical protein ABIQ40_07390 [Bacteroidia bacterium]